MIISRVAEVVGRNEGPSPKSLDLEKTLSTNTRYFVAILRFIRIYALFGTLGAKSAFSDNNSVSRARSGIHGIHCIIY